MGMHNFYPSKWFVVVVCSLLGIGLVFVLFFLYQHDVNSSKLQNTLTTQEANTLNKLVAESDRDKDGLRDWEETLWHTDPDNPDTDGDGTKDGDEVMQNRDPTVKGPNDSLDRLDTQTQNTLVAGTSTGSSTSTNTETVARELFGSYLLLKQTGKLDSTSQAQLIQSISDSVLKQINLTPYTLDDLTIVESTQKNIAAYDTNVGALFSKFITVGSAQKNEVVLLKEALETKDFSKLDTIAADSLIYQDFVTQLRKASVPRDIAPQHLNLINTFQVFTNMSLAMSDIKKDPIKTLSYINQYEGVQAGAQQAFTEIVAYLTAHKPK